MRFISLAAVGLAVGTILIAIALGADLQVAWAGQGVAFHINMAFHGQLARVEAPKWLSFQA